MTVIIQIFDYQYPIGWEWIHYVPLEDWQWLLDIFATLTDNVTTYDYASILNKDCQYTKARWEYDDANNTIYNYINKVDTQGLAKFLNDDQGYEGGIREYGYYIAAKTLGIKSEQEYMDNYGTIQQLCNK